MTDAGSQTNGKTLKILIVDDEDSFRVAMKYNLAIRYKAQVTDVGSGIEAIEKLKADNSYNVIFLDLMMPNLSGIDTFSALRSIDSRIRIVMMSAYSESPEWETAKQMGIELVPKPIPEFKLAQILKCP
jgi:CheY-like chemotaxis protein